MARKKPTLKIDNTKTLVIIFSIVVVLSIIVSLNEAVFRSEHIPTWAQIFAAVGLDEDRYVESGDQLSVHYIDVGQGDCQLIMTPSFSMLIDTGEREYSSEVVNYLSHQGVSTLDYVIITHPHSDHAGGLGDIMKSIQTKNLIMPDIVDNLVPTTATYERILNSIEKYDINLIYAKVDDIIDITSTSYLKILAPVKDYDDLNNYSVVARLVHGQNSFLFTGDIEKTAENDILESGRNITADVYKAAHHGSSTSNQKKFLHQVGAKYAVIGVGSPNSYGHPHKEVIKRFNDQNYEIYRTDLHGNIVFMSDGYGYKISYNKKED